MPIPYAAYRKASHTTSKTRQVVMLYEGAIRFAQQALEAIAQEKPILRYEKLSRVGEIILALQSAVDPDVNPQIARQLIDFYADIDTRIRTLNHRPERAACEQIIVDLRAMRDVWDTIERGAK